VTTSDETVQAGAADWRGTMAAIRSVGGSR
jgi:hypothetical protein